jgi:hypothetical protein
LAIPEPEFTRKKEKRTAENVVKTLRANEAPCPALFSTRQKIMAASDLESAKEECFVRATNRVGKGLRVLLFKILVGS